MGLYAIAKLENISDLWACEEALNCTLLNKNHPIDFKKHVFLLTRA